MFPRKGKIPTPHLKTRFGKQERSLLRSERQNILPFSERTFYTPMQSKNNPNSVPSYIPKVEQGRLFLLRFFAKCMEPRGNNRHHREQCNFLVYLRWAKESRFHELYKSAVTCLTQLFLAEMGEKKQKRRVPLAFENPQEEGNVLLMLIFRGFHPTLIIFINDAWICA